MDVGNGMRWETVFLQPNNTKWLYGGAKDADQPWVADDIISVGASGMDAAQGEEGGRNGERERERESENHTLLTASQDTL